jgi:hypothetical protein
MKAQYFVIYDAVKQLEPTEPKKKPGPGIADIQAAVLAQIGKKIKPGHERDQFAGVKKAIGNQTNERRRLIIKVMPRENLMKNDFINRGHKTDAQQRSRERRPGVGRCATERGADVCGHR